MSRQRRVWGVIVTATIVWLLGIGVLGTQWKGVELAPGEWRDAVTLRQWAWFWGAMLIAGAWLGGYVRTWPTRVVALLPLLIWLALELRTGTLAPLAWLIYAAPTSLVWLGGTVAGDLIRGPLARGVKHRRA